ncbi:uncharacterized protein LOC113675454 isoform X1 [Pocillopora damicornis]|uniref:uncharacterized protein LOC113675454 isoform X1 n=1 Tax=Pocillopora damicornis TaxID=46731 RepID=UPI000F54FEBD|nr:uncharacterized protein LOC113675454 isoform X1 [Pocillopora damicornis]XP_027047848.1 uncharacterized protein LOC113675454 isoform X1 [Pocillopora damicornis]
MKYFRVYVVIASLLLLVTALLFCINLYPRPSLDVFPNVLPQPNGKLERELTFLYRNVESFVLFVGHPRSGHSLVAAILDSHPEIIISNEFNLLYKFDSFFKNPSQTDDERKLRIFYDLHTRSRRQAMFGSRSSICDSSVSYCYNIKGGWQGYCKSKLKVIGDKKASVTTARLHHEKGLHDLRKLEKVVGIPIKLINVIRNPFDNIATICRRRLGVNPRSHQIVRNTTALDFCIDFYFNKVWTVQYLRDLSHYQILNVCSRDLLTNPRRTLQILCDFVGVSCYSEFVELATRDLYSKSSRSRYLIEWNNEQKEKVMKEIQKYSFLKSLFSFDSD